MLLSAFAFSLMTLFVKLAGQRLPSQEVATARAALTLLFSYVAVRQAGQKPLGSRRPLLWLRGTLGFLALSSLYYAVTHLPLAEATVIQYLHPALTAALGALFLGERFDRVLAASMALSTLGLVLVAQPALLFGATSAALDGLAVAAAVFGAVCSACVFVTVRKLSSSDHPLVIVLYFPLVALPASIPIMLEDALWPQGIEWLYLLLVGISTQVGQVAMTRALAQDEAGRIAAYSYVQIPLAALWGALFFGALPSSFTLLGTLCILVGAVINTRASRPVGAAVGR